MSEELPKRYFIWGEPDTGKTLFVNRLAQRMKSNVYTKRCGGSWEGYNGEKVVHIEDLVSDNIQCNIPVRITAMFLPFQLGLIHSTEIILSFQINLISLITQYAILHLKSFKPLFY